MRLNISLADGYKAASQKSRVVTEDWVARNMFCPICGKPVLSHYENNRPVADFYCDNCKSDFELKSKESKSGRFAAKIPDGAYTTMIERITSLQNPNFFFLTYAGSMVSNFVLVPNHFFVPEIIEKRPPLGANARRAGWEGCNINLQEIPETGKIYIIQNGIETDKSRVVDCYARTKMLKTNKLESRGWMMDVLKCIERIPTEDFKLTEVYAFAEELQGKHTENNFVKDKIRQQLQILRDKGFISFTSRGHYKKI